MQGYLIRMRHRYMEMQAAKGHHHHHHVEIMKQNAYDLHGL